MNQLHHQVSPAELSDTERTLINTALMLASRLDEREVCRGVLDAAQRVFAARSCWILLTDSTGKDLVPCEFRGPDGAVYANATVPVHGGSVAARVLSSRDPIFVADPKAEEHWFDVDRFRHSRLQSVFTVPLPYEETALGVLGVDSPRFSHESPPDQADTARLMAIAAQAAIAIHNARLFREIEDDRVRLRRLLHERRSIRGELEHLRSEIKQVRHQPTGIIGDSVGIRAVTAQMELVAPADTTVLITGETGTGKELLARAVHERSRRASHPFIAVNCAALPDSLVESELFGYEKGAFTGALARKPGKFEIANGGTIFLDEVGDLPAQAQAKLLRVLQHREVDRVGGSRPVPVNVRVIAATNQDLLAATASGVFRNDLFYRLSVFPIDLPPLRERRGDIPALTSYFVERFAIGRVPEVAETAVALLQQYEWPGNVRELQNVIERAVLLARNDGLITPRCIALHSVPDVRHARAPVASPVEPRPLSSEPTVVPLSEAERRVIMRALELAGWRVSGPDGAACALGLKPTTLHAKMKKLGIRRPSVSSLAADRTGG